jgi:DNA polymerase III delta prime subunit
MMMKFKKAVKSESKLRLALIGPSGSGKTFTALTFARTLAKKRVAVIDTERGSAAKYADLFDFDVLELERHSPNDYVAAIEACVAGGDHDVIVIDSLSHAWMGKDGALEQVDKEAARSVTKNSFAAWRTVTPMHNRLVDALVSPPLHVIATMRSKTEWVVEKDEKGKSTPRKIGTAAVQRDGLEYEFDVVADMDPERNLMVVSKSRCPDLSGQAIEKPGPEVAELLQRWLAGAASAFGVAVNAVMVARTQADLAQAAELAKALSGPDKERIRPIFAARRERILQSTPAEPAAVVTTTAPEQGEAELPVDPPHIDDVDESLMPHDVFAVQAVGDLPPSLAGAIAYVELRNDGHWLMPDDAGGWQPPASAHDRRQLRAVAEAHFASRGWTDLGEAGKVDLDAGGARLLAEVQPAPAHALAPTKAPSEPAPAAQAPLSPHLPGWATPRELQGVIASVKDSQGRQRKVSLFTEAQIKPAKAKDGDLLFRFFPGAADKPQLMEWQQDQWTVLPAFDPLLECVRAALVVDIKARNKVCQFGASMLLAFAKERIQDQQFDAVKDLTVRSLVQLRAAMAEQQKKGSPE